MLFPAWIVSSVIPVLTVIAWWVYYLCAFINPTREKGVLVLFCCPQYDTGCPLNSVPTKIGS